VYVVKKSDPTAIATAQTTTALAAGDQRSRTTASLRELELMELLHGRTRKPLNPRNPPGHETSLAAGCW
jgi:hypothetical protein